VLRESAHYVILKNISADPTDVEADNYLLVLKEHNTIEAHSHAYVIILMHMLDAEAAYDSVMANFEKPIRAVRVTENESIN